MQGDIVYLIGAPASGKSTLFAALTGGLRSQDATAGGVPHTVWEGKYAHTIELGKRRDDFSGTDALSMSIQPKVLKLLGMPGIHRRIIAEGDRLANAKFFQAVVDAGWNLTVFHLDTPPELLEQRREEREQDAKWAKGRDTKVANLVAAWPTIRIPGDAPLDEQLAVLLEHGGPAIGALIGGEAPVFPAEPELEKYRPTMMEYRVRARHGAEYMEAIKGKRLDERHVTLKAEGACRVLKPDGKLLLVYLPAALVAEADAAYPVLTKIRATTDNRGLASGTERAVRKEEAGKRTRSKVITSSIIGSFDPVGSMPYCRLTAYSGRETEAWPSLFPLFQAIGRLLAEHVPDRYANQVREAESTHPDWVIPGTPFTTITVNNTYPTGVHTDKGDLDAGFSTLLCVRRGAYSGGWLTFPEFGISADMQNGDLMLMDAHEWHGNTRLYCDACGEELDMPGHRCELMEPHGASPERISLVSYFRTQMVGCDSMDAENLKRVEHREQRNAKVAELGDVPL